MTMLRFSLMAFRHDYFFMPLDSFRYIYCAITLTMLMPCRYALIDAIRMLMLYYAADVDI